MRSRRARSVAALCAGLVVLGACGDDAVSNAGTESGAAATAAPAPPVTNAAEPAADPAADAATTNPAVPAPDVPLPDSLAFSAPLVGGGTFDGASVAGAPVAFWFWAPG